jgi:hypothetical protein
MLLEDINTTILSYLLSREELSFQEGEILTSHIFYVGERIFL